MSSPARIPLVFAALGALLLSAAVAAVTPEESEAMARKLEEIRARGDAELLPEPPATARRTVVTEGEINSWLALVGVGAMRGVTAAEVTLAMDGRISGVATIDLEALRDRSAGGGLDPLSLLSGLVPVAVRGRLETGVAQGRFSLEQASIAGLEVPAAVLQQLLTRYTRTPENPAGVRFDEPFVLPAGIDRIVIGAGRAIVVQ